MHILACDGHDCSAAGAQRQTPGLVDLSTSTTGSGPVPFEGAAGLEFTRIEFDPREARLRRMRDGIQLGIRLGEAVVARPGHRPPVAWMVTLTYRQPGVWEPRHVSAFIDCLTKWAKRQSIGCAGAWCAEMQDKRYRIRGELAIHYHVIVWLPRGITPPKPDSRGWWRWGMSQRVRVLKSASAYISKYASKGSEAPLPKGARIYGVFGLAVERVRYTWLRRPMWLRSLVEVGERLVRRRGGGWSSVATGEVLRSPWVVGFAHGKVIMRKMIMGESPWQSAIVPS